MNSRLLSVLRKETREILCDPTAASRGYTREFVDSGYFGLVANVKEYDVEFTQHFTTTFGPLTLYRARRSV